MSSFAMTLPYMRMSPVRIPCRDLVLGRADSLFLRVTVVDSDDICAQGIDLSGGADAPVLQMLVWSGHGCRASWDYGAWPDRLPSPLWVGTGVDSDAIGAFDISFSTATMSSWPRRCVYALQLGFDDGSELLATGHLHLAYSLPASMMSVHV